MKHARYQHQVAVSRQPVEHRSHGVLGLVDVSLPPPFQPHARTITADPHRGLGKAALNHIGRHEDIHHETRLEPQLAQARLGSRGPAQRDAEHAGVLQVQPTGQDSPRIQPVEVREPVQGEDRVLGQERDNAVDECRMSRMVWIEHARVEFRESSVGEHDAARRIRMIDRRDDVAVRDQLLHIRGVMLAKTTAAV